ncbi:hypothetical protein PIB30_050876 [Stylosanthes scabra]|uniref:Uncharacterized protein n=1 Tax=Stylosanthes scabra TaxID=79078 RepID=A0ABU6TIM1_9FABA|nr:hypothetical protein [Stylosanthes scabra]
MLGSNSSYSRRSHGSFARSPNRSRSEKVPQWCGCDYEEEDSLTGEKDTQNGTDFWKNNWGRRIANVEDEIRKLKGWNFVLTLIYVVIVFVMVGYIVG